MMMLLETRKLVLFLEGKEKQRKQKQKQKQRMATAKREAWTDAVDP